MRKAGCGARGKWLFRLPARSAATVPDGGLSSSLPADPAFSLLSCPHPPAPSRREGGFLVFLCKGLRPLHPRELNPAALIDPAMQGIRRGLVSSPPADPAFSLLSCPHPPAPSRREGGILSFLMQGASPLASPGAETGRHLQPLPCRASGGGLSSSPPANPAFSLLSCPHPPAPSRREGGFLVFLCKGLRPLHPRELNPAALINPAMQGIRRGLAFFPACRPCL